MPKRKFRPVTAANPPVSQVPQNLSTKSHLQQQEQAPHGQGLVEQLAV